MTRQEQLRRCRCTMYILQGAVLIHVGPVICEQVQNLKNVRSMASELYSYNTMSLEAEEMRSRLAGLRQQATQHSAPPSSPESPSNSAASSAALLEERAETGASASSSSSTEERAGMGVSADERLEDRSVDRVKRQNEEDEVAELASRLWDGSGVGEDILNGQTLHGHTAEGATARGAGSDADRAAEVHILAGGVNLPHPGKAATGGDDAFFTSTAHGGAVGVADGVSGWSREGVDASLYSR